MALTPMADLDVERAGTDAEIKRAAARLKRYGQNAPVRIRGREVVGDKVLVAAAASLGWMFLETTSTR